MPELCEEIPIWIDDIPRKRMSNKVKVDFNVKATKKDAYGEEDEVKESDIQDLIKNFKKNLINSIQNKTHTIVVKILQFLLFSCPEQKATKQEIMDICDINRFEDFTCYNQIKGRNKLLIQDNSYWKINPEILLAIKDLVNRLDF